MIMKIFRLLTQLYPRGYRSTHIEEMVFVLGKTNAEHRDLVSRVGFAIREMAGLVWGAIAAWQMLLVVQGSHHRLVRATNINQLPEDVQDAQVLLDDAIEGMTFAIAEKRFEHARRYSNEEQKARAALREARSRYGLGDIGAS